MSRTYRNTTKYNKKRWLGNQFKELNDLDYDDPKYWALKDRVYDNAEFFLSECNYNKNPSSWNREYHTKPRRADDRLKLRAILKGEDPDEILFLEKHNKPNVYYW